MELKSKILAILAAAGLIFSSNAAPGSARQLKLSLDYPVAELTNILSFNFYTNASLSAPASSWIVYTNFPAVTNYVVVTSGALATFEFPLTPFGAQLFLFTTASNIAGESLPSPSVAVPAQPSPPPSLRIK